MLKFLSAAAGVSLCLGLSLAATGTTQSDRLAAVKNSALYFEGGSSQNLFRARGAQYEFLIAPAELGIWLVKDSAAQASDDRRATLNTHRQLRGIRASFLGGNPRAQLLGEFPGRSKVNYLQGPPSEWRQNIGTFAAVRVRELYAGVDVIYYGNQRHLEYDFEVQPGTDPSVIQITFSGVDSLQLNSDGSMTLKLGPDSMEQPKPVFYQVINGRRQHVSGGFRVIDPKTLGFEVGAYDREHPLILDPILSYSTYFGGNEGDLALAVKLDPSGNVYVAGQTLSTHFPVTLPPGGFQTDFGGGRINGDSFIAKFAPDGSMAYFTYLGGKGNDGALDLAVDSFGQVRVAGFTDSPDFPTRNPVFPAISGGEVPNGVYYMDAFVAQLNASGSDLVFSTFLGGTNIDTADAVAVDPDGYTYVGGYTYSTNFPVTAGALANATNDLSRFQGGLYDGFVAKFGPGGTPLIYSSFVGGTNVDEVQGIAADANGFAYITGYTSSTNYPTFNPFRPYLNGWHKLPLLKDAFVSKISPSGHAFEYSTFLGGTNSDAGFRITTDVSGAAYIVGSTLSRDFPNSATNIPGLKVGFTGGSPSTGDAFLTKILPNGQLGPSSRFGGPHEDVAWDVALDGSGNIFVVGITSSSSDFPVYGLDGWPLPNKAHAKDETVFVTAFNADWTSLLYSLLFGGDKKDYGYGIAADPAGNVYIVGRTLSTSFPVADALQPQTADKNDAFVSKINLEPTLSTTAGPEGITIRWRAFSPEYHLETNPDAGSESLWVPLSVQPELRQGWHEVKVPATEGRQLFRLKRAE